MQRIISQAPFTNKAAFRSMTTPERSHQPSIVLTQGLPLT